MMKCIRIEVSLDRANVIAACNSAKVNQTIEWWADALTKQSDPDHRGFSKDVIIEALKTDQHHTDPEVAEMVIGAALWLVGTGPTAATMLPFLRAGDMALGIEVTPVKGSTLTYNFRTKLDPETGAMASL